MLTTKPGDKYQSIQRPKVYRALRKRGYSKEAAARISNAQAPGHTVKSVSGQNSAAFASVSAPMRSELNTMSNTGVVQTTASRKGVSPDPVRGTPPLLQDYPAVKSVDQTSASSFLPSIARKASAAVPAVIPPIGRDALFNQPGIESRRARLRKRKVALKAPNYAARAGQVIAGGLSRANDGKFTGTGGGGGATEAKPKKPTSGKPAKAPKKTPEQRNAERATARAATLAKREAERTAARDAAYRKLNIAPDGQAALEKLRTGDMADTEAIQRAGLEDAGLVERDSEGKYHLTPSGRATVNAASRGDAGRAGDTIASARDRLRARRERQATAARKRQDRLDKLAGKAFTVFKDASGKYRWIVRSTTTFQDRDREILSQKALDDDAMRMTATKQFGPLRYWHVGNPDQFNIDAPWGSGLDLGMCDYSTVIGRTSIESGTFDSDEIGEAVSKSADEYELSPGFFYGKKDRDANGVFWSIKRFERSLVPIQFVRASNLFTGLAVQRTKSMDTEEYERRVKAFLTDMHARGVKPETAAAVITEQQQHEKAADAMQIAHKDTPAPPAEITIGGIIYAVKAFPPAPVEEEEAPPEEMVEAAATEMAEEPLDEGPLLTEADASMIAQAVVSAIAPLLDMEKKMRGYMDEMKAVWGGAMATKDAAVSEQGASLAATQKQLVEVTARLKELEGDQPAGGYRASQRAESALLAQAMKDAGQLPGLVNTGATQPLNGLATPEEQAAYKLLWGDQP